MVIDAQYTRSREVCSMPSLCDPPPRLTSEATCPFTRSTRTYRTGCCTLPFVAAGNIVLSHALHRRVSHSTRRRSTKDRSIFVTRSSRHTREARRLDRADYLEVGAHAPQAFASCGQAKEHGKIIKSATRCVIAEELISEIAQVHARELT